MVIQASEFVSLVGNVNQIVSVGNFSTLYADFNSYVAQYFGFANGNFPMGSEWGFGTLFTGELTFSTTQTNQPGIFQAAQFVHLLMANGTADTNGSGITSHNALNVSSDEQAAGLNYGGDISGAYITNLAGSLTVTGITKLLRNAVDANPFNNRGVESPYWASDAHDNIDFGVAVRNNAAYFWTGVILEKIVTSPTTRESVSWSMFSICLPERTPFTGRPIREQVL